MVWVDAWWLRAKTMCGSAWGMPPASWDAACEADEIAVEEVFELFMWECADPMRVEGVRAFWLREQRAKAMARKMDVERAYGDLRAAITRGAPAAEIERLSETLRAANAPRKAG